MSLITSNSLFQTAASGLEVQKKRLEAAAQNIANSRGFFLPVRLVIKLNLFQVKDPKTLIF